MSLRNVSEKESRGLYATPRWPVHLLLTAEACTTCGEPVPRLPGGRWLEPCAGEGSIIYAANEIRRDVEWTAIEVDADLVTNHLQPAQARGEIAHVARADFFDLVTPYEAGGGPSCFDVALANPAFPDAARFTAACRRLTTWTVMLERLDWLSGGEETKRAEFFSEVGEPDVWTLPNRPSFRGRGQDSGDYAWFIWGPTTTGRHHRLPLVSPELRRENRKQLLLGGSPR